jgi:hypothetical protein
MKFSLITLISIMTFSTKTLSIMTFSIITMSIKIFSITTPSVKGPSVTHSIQETQHKHHAS